MKLLASDWLADTRDLGISTTPRPIWRVTVASSKARPFETAAHLWKRAQHEAAQLQTENLQEVAPGTAHWARVCISLP